MKALTIVTSISEVLVLASLAFGQTTPTVPSVGRDSTAVQELTGIVSDGVCKGQHNRKAVTQFGCTLKCVGDGADYVLVVGERVYILEGHKADLDKFAGGRATVAGRVNDDTVVVDSVTAIKKKAKAGNADS
jgi:hypothetical protein